MVKQFYITLKDRVSPADEQRFVDTMRQRVDVASVFPIVEMSSPMTEEALKEIKKEEVRWTHSPYASIIRLLMVEVERARLAELIISKALQVSAHERKELEHKISVLEQRLAQFGVTEERR
jgi:hypothetical protein